jgi:beta-lactamase superfamily II metal-dependent hydrolase
VHPVQATLDAITASGTQVWRTDQHGTVTITFQGGVSAVVADR